MNSASRTEVESTVLGLSDDQLLEQIGKLARLDHQVQVFVIDHLCEIEARRLYLARGFSSLFDYVSRGLGYSAAAAWRRINAMKLCTRIEGVRERLRDGSLTLDTAAQLQAAFERRDRERAREARSAGAGAGPAMRPNGSAPAGPARPPAPKPMLDVSAQKALVEEAVGKSTRQVMQMLAEVDPVLAVPADRVRALGEGRWELKAVIDAECQRGLEQLRGLLSNVDPHMTLGQLVGRLVKEGLGRHDPSRPRRTRCTASRTSDAERTSAPKRSAPPTGIISSPAQTRQVQNQERPSSTNGSAQPANITSSAPKSQRDMDRKAPSAAKQPTRPACATTSAPKSCGPGRAIPAAVKREIWQRDRGRCGYVDPRTGRRCASRHLLQIDHVFPYALGGGAEPVNLRLLCAAHHRHAERAPSREPAEWTSGTHCGSLVDRRTPTRIPNRRPRRVVGRIRRVRRQGTC